MTLNYAPGAKRFADALWLIGTFMVILAVLAGAMSVMNDSIYDTVLLFIWLSVIASGLGVLATSFVIGTLSDIAFTVAGAQPEKPSRINQDIHQKLAKNGG